jgi:hypothetical protein
MANPFPFTAGQVLTAAQMNGIGEAATAFTPTYAATTYTRGNGTTIAYYMRVNKLIYVYVQETLGTTSSVGAGGITMNLPITASRTNSVQLAPSRIDDTGTNFFFGVTIPDSTTTVGLVLQKSSGTYVDVAFINATTPFTWASTDKFTLSFVYEAA